MDKGLRQVQVLGLGGSRIQTGLSDWGSQAIIGAM
jgi:hypothetical protein